MVNKIDLIPDEEFIKLVKNSTCSADILKSLDYSAKGNSWGYKIIAERMAKLNITFGKKYHINSTGSLEKLPLEKILTEDSNYNRSKLRQRLIEANLKENKCEVCGISEWMDKPISLQLHHLNGIHNDNRLSNLQLLCPNCHSQTENFGTKGKGTVIKRKCDSLPEEDIKKIMDTVREYGIVEARKRLHYRNSLINSVVNRNHDKIIMVTLEKEIPFNTTYEAAAYLCNLGIGKNPESVRASISKCLNNKQKSIKGYTFYKRSVTA